MSTPRPPVPLSLVPSADGPGASDAILGRALVAGDAWAVAETWRRFAPMVLKMAERALGSRSEADDVCQDVFYYLLRKAKTLRDPDSLRSFVYSFAVRELKYQLRRRRLRSWLSSSHEPEDLADVRSHSLDVESRDLLRKCYAVLDRLSPRDRLVFVLRRMESMTVEEIATTMDLSVSTVKRSMNHASGRLSRWIRSDPSLAELVQTERMK
jgi:RNA polymerase sigma factor (sigma-70 family)